MFLDSTISFNETTYICGESGKQSQHVLVLNKPLLIDDVVEIMDFSITATGESILYISNYANNIFCWCQKFANKNSLTT